MFYGVSVKPGQTVKLSPEDGGEVLHLSQVCMTNPKDSNRTYVQVTQEGKTYSVCMLQKDKQEFTTLDLFFSTRQGVSIKTEGGKNEVHLTGYFEPEPEDDIDSEEDEELESDVEVDMMEQAHGRKHVPSKGGKVEDLDANEDDEDDEDEDDEDGGKMKALTAGDEEEDDEEDEEGDEDEEDDEDDEKALNGLAGESDEDDEEEEDEEDEEEEDEENEAAPQGKKKVPPSAGQADKKRKAAATPVNNSQASNKKAKAGTPAGKGQAPGGAKGGNSGDASAYKTALIDFLKKNGKTPLATLGQKVKKPAGVSEKMAQFLKAHASTFEVADGSCSLK
ncbi:nuclear factor nf3 [Cystoisospora suis]|uniref:Nuclear factor nf3 n=1 Tax=Cystoisospora suis TaxID=483139 RepID=A0A2C6KH85_9APIC|nr:nuclear factor nf3 [Cystoisospora suis]